MNRCGRKPPEPQAIASSVQFHRYILKASCVLVSVSGPRATVVSKLVTVSALWLGNLAKNRAKQCYHGMRHATGEGSAKDQTGVSRLQAHMKPQFLNMAKFFTLYNSIIALQSHLPPFRKSLRHNCVWIWIWHYLWHIVSYFFSDTLLDISSFAQILPCTTRLIFCLSL